MSDSMGSVLQAERAASPVDGGELWVVLDAALVLHQEASEWPAAGGSDIPPLELLSRNRSDTAPNTPVGRHGEASFFGSDRGGASHSGTTVVPVGHTDRHWAKGQVRAGLPTVNLHPGER